MHCFHLTDLLHIVRAESMKIATVCKITNHKQYFSLLCSNNKYLDHFEKENQTYVLIGC